MLTLADILLLIGLAFLGATAQLCFKRGANLGGSGNFLRSLFQPWVITGAVLMAANTLVMVWALRRLPLTSAIAITSLAYVLVPTGAFLFFKERLLPLFWFGALLIITGIVVIAV